tara:strand:+ start:1791 stop:1928 length:138 start_codon:yes stop_codon:yes gene_type:complete
MDLEVASQQQQSSSSYCPTATAVKVHFSFLCKIRIKYRCFGGGQY